MRFFAEHMGWRWQGGVGFGGTSPIDGRPLDEAGMFSGSSASACRSCRRRGRRPAVLGGHRRALRQVAVPYPCH